MSTIDTTVDLARSRLPSRWTLVFVAAVLYTELMALGLYWSLGDVTVTDPRFALYGLVWLNVGGWVLLTLDYPSAGTTTRRRTGALALGYFAVLAYTGGLVGPAGQGETFLRLAWLPPGWGPALFYHGEFVQVVLMPAKLVGYLALAALVYRTALAAAGSAVSGLVGVFSCVSCSWPVLASVASAVLGGGSFVATATLSSTYGLSTAVFLLTVGLLVWQPSVR